jgi:hypothetical protein
VSPAARRPRPPWWQRGRPGPLAGLALLAATAAGAAGCTLMVDSSAAGCASDRDCRAYPGAVCNPKTWLCAPSAVARASTPLDAAEEDGAGLPGPGAGSDASERWACNDVGKPRVRLNGDIGATTRLVCGNDYLLTGPVVVKPGVVLTIDPGTTIYGDTENKGRLIVQPGGRLVANGLRAAPIVFTSLAAPEARAPGDWGGVVLLGRARVNGPDVELPGISPAGVLVGKDDADDSGVLRYVRIEYAGAAAVPGAVPAGLTLAGAGSKTVLSYVQIRRSAGDCLSFVGGTANGKHLVCQLNGGDGVRWDRGYRGKLQFLVVQQDPAAAATGDGVQGDSDPLGAGDLPVTEPVVYNASLCGSATDPPGEQYAILLQRGARAHFHNTLALGFEAGFDLRDRARLDITSSLFGTRIAYVEDGSNTGTQADDDRGRDEVTLYNEPARRNGSGRPNIGDCFNPGAIGFAPSPAIRSNAKPPPADGFLDTSANYIGAFRDFEDTWTRGPWLVWQPR